MALMAGPGLLRVGELGLVPKGSFCLRLLQLCWLWGSDLYPTTGFPASPASPPLFLS